MRILFAARCAKLTGADLQILGGDEEALASYLGARHGLVAASVAERHGLTVADIGGGALRSRGDGGARRSAVYRCRSGGALTERFLVSIRPRAKSAVAGQRSR